MVSSTSVAFFAVLSLIQASYASQQPLTSSTPYGSTAPATNTLRRFQTKSEEERELLLEAAQVSSSNIAYLRTTLSVHISPQTEMFGR